ncbi:MAG: hypothetical protein ACRYGR_01060 [Janthinobacterium lividum]
MKIKKLLLVTTFFLGSILPVMSSNVDTIVDESKPSFLSYKPFSSSTFQDYYTLNPQAFRGIKKIDMELVQKRQSSPQSYQQDHLHNETLKTLTHEWKKYFSNLKDQHADLSNMNDVIDTLVSEINSHLDNQQVSLQWVTSLPARFAAGLSQPSEDEKTVYNSILDTPNYERFFENDVWKSFSAFNALFNEDIAIDFNKTYTNLPHQYRNLVQENIRLYLSPPVLYPVNDIVYFSPLELMMLYLSDIHPLALTKISAKRKAHGVGDQENTTIFGHFFHDKFHAEMDSQQQALAQHILDQSDYASEVGKNVSDFIKSYTPYAVERYQKIKDVFKHILEVKMAEAVQENNSKLPNQNLLALFLGIHEYAIWNSAMFQTDSAADLVSQFTENTISALESPYAWESPEDVFETDAYTGKSLLSDEEIIKLSGIKNQPLQHQVSEFKQYLDADIDTVKVERSTRFIDVTLLLKTGQTIKKSYATLAHKLKNSDDILNLLRFSGVNDLVANYRPLLTPEAHTEQEEILGNFRKVENEITKGYISILQQTCTTLVTNFRYSALSILDQGYEKSFQAWSQQNRQKTRELYNNTKTILSPKFELMSHPKVKLLNY